MKKEMNEAKMNTLNGKKVTRIIFTPNYNSVFTLCEEDKETFINAERITTAT